MQKIGDAIIASGKPDALLGIITNQMLKPPAKPTIVAPGHVVLNPEGTGAAYTAPVEDKYTPYSTNLGGSVEQGVINTRTGERKSQGSKAVSSAPARELPPEQVQNMQDMRRLQEMGIQQQGAYQQGQLALGRERNQLAKDKAEAGAMQDQTESMAPLSDQARKGVAAALDGLKATGAYQKAPAATKNRMITDT